eukprot:TRINITY_DN21882_c0_g1_i2.p1 TRINITY_DN21882_c0_g1~~TRINITY_DN21882_c0_g1_i2.p1  ORF type:complete len:1067 (+),score=39.73 TRINITY_DN21882_c0_g1_i2:200-3400(+)
MAPFSVFTATPISANDMLFTCNKPNFTAMVCSSYGAGLSDCADIGKLGCDGAPYTLQYSVPNFLPIPMQYNAAPRGVALYKAARVLFVACGNAVQRCSWDNATKTAHNCAPVPTAVCPGAGLESGVALHEDTLIVSCGSDNGQVLTDSGLFFCPLDPAGRLIGGCGRKGQDPCAEARGQQLPVWSLGVSLDANGGLIASCWEGGGAYCTRVSGTAGASDCKSMAQPCPTQTASVFPQQLPEGLLNVFISSSGMPAFVCRGDDFRECYTPPPTLSPLPSPTVANSPPTIPPSTSLFSSAPSTAPSANPDGPTAQPAKLPYPTAQPTGVPSVWPSGSSAATHNPTEVSAPSARPSAGPRPSPRPPTFPPAPSTRPAPPRPPTPPEPTMQPTRPPSPASSAPQSAPERTPQLRPQLGPPIGPAVGTASGHADQQPWGDIAVGLAAVSGTSGAMAQVSVISMLDVACDEAGTFHPMPRVLHPTQWSVDGNIYLGCILGAATIIAGAAAASQLAVMIVGRADSDGDGIVSRAEIRASYLRYIPGVSSADGNDVTGAARFPSFIVASVMFTYQGAIFSALRLAVGPRQLAWGRMLGSLIAIVGVIFTCWLYIRVLAGVEPVQHHRDPPGAAARPLSRLRLWGKPQPSAVLRYLVLSERGDWVSCRPTKHWVNSWQVLVRQYRPQRAAAVVALDFATMFALGLVHAPAAETPTACGHVRVAAAVVLLLQLFYTVLQRPHRAARDTVIGSVHLGAQQVTLLWLAVGFYGGEVQPDTPGFPLELAAGLALARVVLCYVQAALLLVFRWRAALQRREWSMAGNAQHQHVEGPAPAPAQPPAPPLQLLPPINPLQEPTPRFGSPPAEGQYHGQAHALSRQELQPQPLLPPGTQQYKPLRLHQNNLASPPQRQPIPNGLGAAASPFKEGAHEQHARYLAARQLSTGTQNQTRQHQQLDVMPTGAGPYQPTVLTARRPLLHAVERGGGPPPQQGRACAGGPGVMQGPSSPAPEPVTVQLSGMQPAVGHGGRTPLGARCGAAPGGRQAPVPLPALRVFLDRHLSGGSPPPSPRGPEYTAL